MKTTVTNTEELSHMILDTHNSDIDLMDITEAL